MSNPPSLSLPRSPASQNPRIAVLFEYPTLLGGERSFLSCVERLRGRFEFVALAPPRGLLAEALCTANVELHPSPLTDKNGKRLSRPVAVPRLVECVRSIRADVLHGNSLATGRLTGAAAPELPILCTAHLRDILGLSKQAVNDLNGNARLIAVSAATRTYHVAQGLDPNKVVVIHNGIDIEQFALQEERNDARRELGVPSDAFVALTIGQIGLRKGWDVLAEALEMIAGRHGSLHAVFVGERYSKKSETVELERSVKRRATTAMPGRVHFLGYRADVPRLMAATDLLVHPARQEPFGRVLLEAAASGLPIVATNIGGTPEMLENGVSARLVPAGDATTLANAVAELLDNADLRRRLARAAKERVESEFPIEAASQKLAAVWQEVLSASQSADKPREVARRMCPQVGEIRSVVLDRHTRGQRLDEKQRARLGGQPASRAGDD